MRHDLRGVVWHDDDGFGVEGPGSVRYALSVVAGGVSNNAKAELLRGELRAHVVGAAKLEGADRLGGLCLDVDVGVGEMDEGSADGGRGDAGMGGLDLWEGDVGGHLRLLCFPGCNLSNRTGYSC